MAKSTFVPGDLVRSRTFRLNTAVLFRTAQGPDPGPNIADNKAGTLKSDERCLIVATNDLDNFHVYRLVFVITSHKQMGWRYEDDFMLL